MLHSFLSAHRADILARARAMVTARQTPRATEDEVESGLPIFLDQLIQILRSSTEATGDIPESAARHGASLQKRGFTVAQVVHDYGGICQAVTELADETRAPITADEFRIFNRCLDDAIARAVTEFTRQRERSIAEDGRERLGELAHELRNALAAASVSFEVLRLGKVGIGGSTAAVLDRSLRRLTALVDQSLTEVRLEAALKSPTRVSIGDLVDEVAVWGSMEASARSMDFSVVRGESHVDVLVDRGLFAAAVANLLQNAFKFTRPNGHVWLRATATPLRSRVEIEDECGGLPEGVVAELFRPFEQRGLDRRGLGLGLSITRKSIEASGGQVQARDLPGRGCVFAVDMPRLPSP